VRAGGELPTSKAGAIVSLADRMDTIAGCFAIGLIPTGNADPFALRRHALAIIRIVESMEWDLSLTEFIEKNLLILGQEISFDRDSVFAGIQDFFRERYRHMMLRSGYESDSIVAVISVTFDRLCGLRSRIDCLKEFASESDEFQALTVTFKRVTNILKKQKQSYEVSSELFKDECESILWKSYQAVKVDVYACMEKREFHEALNLLTRLRKPVDDFFDAIEILTKKDDRLRENRVGLLQRLSDLFANPEE